MDACDVLAKIGDGPRIDEGAFYRLIADFRRDFLERENYWERLELHRNPIAFKNQLLRKLYDQCLSIQNREELRCLDLDSQGITCVPSVIKEMRERDKRIRSLFDLVSAYCGLRQADFNLIAVHIAEYRAVNNLIGRFQRDTISPQFLANTGNFTFDDWLQNKFWREKTYGGEYVVNDSAKYLDLVADGRMAYDELNKIQDAQQKAYDYLIECTLDLNLRLFRRQTKDSLDLNKVIENKIDEAAKYMAEYPTILNEVITPHKHRGIKIGATFLLPEYYLLYQNKSIADVYNLKRSTYEVNLGNKLVSFPTPEQLQYMFMEAQLRWFRILQNYKEQRRYERMLLVKDFKELIDTYGEGDKLMDQYRKGLEFAPDGELYIQTRISNHESVLLQFSSAMGVYTTNYDSTVQIQTGEYRRIGYAWVNNDHNALPEDLRTITFRNADLVSTVPAESLYSVYNHVLYQLACGGAIAFHLAFLRNELKKPAAPKALSKPASFCWQGTDEQRLELFDLLAEDSFMAESDVNRGNFLNNRPVLWKLDGRSLFYLLYQLKDKRYKMLLVNENLGPLVRNNFRDKLGKEFRNISQNMGGMLNANKGGKPRHADKIDEILRKAFKK